MYSLDPLASHNLKHFLSAALIQTSPAVPVADVRLNIEALAGQASICLVLERRERRVVTEPREERLHRVGDMGDERDAVPKRYCRYKRLKYS